DGMIDVYSGHGTFICGLVHQGCPDADILSWRVVGSEGPIVESDLVETLRRIAEFAWRYHGDPAKERPLDVLNLSMGYYHETPEDAQFDPTMYEILRLLGEAGVTVVCSAGNDATARPMFPAAFTPWMDGNGGYLTGDDCAPIVSVGALNPNGTTDALFSNAGPWVRVHEHGAAIFSTIPETFNGGLQPVARTVAYQRERASIDPDDFRGGFAVWSGTSFSAPVFAGRVAAALLGGLPKAPGQGDPPPDPKESAQASAKRAWEAVTPLVDLRAVHRRKDEREVGERMWQRPV
ncbi:MAG TPA: S8/S53 family peptidase, partial [Dermatophilaceae bacterium]|nr:S8/S53 family peptidase [Dermatophilaceae bacterium]